MIYLLITAWVWWNNLFLENQISQNNKARQEAQTAYLAGNFHRALELYANLSRTTTTIDPAVRLNLGHTYYHLKQYNKARAQYETLLQSNRSDLRTAAATQLGVLSCLEGDSAIAMSLFQKALLENPDNESARYNFELIKTHFSGKGHSKQHLVRQQTQVNKPRPSGGQQVERTSRKEEILRRFQNLNLTEEQALQLLNSMQTDDLPYALTRAARQSATKPKPTTNRW